ncbi:MAG: ATP-binding protein, partial [Thermotogota bacterium]|nr:ATP-binding protein [Thermotogota bacterium]
YTVNVSNKMLVVIEISKGGLLPYYVKKKGVNEATYIRVGPTNRKASKNNIIELERQRQNISFDEEPDFFTNFDELDIQALKKEFANVGKKLTKEKLKSLKLIVEKKHVIHPTKGLLILLGIYENCKFKCARFKGTNMSVFIDKKEYEGDLFSQLRNTENFIKNHINVGTEITKLNNPEVSEIPYAAIREALINTVVHRDYSNMGRDIKVGIYDDILDIVSPGGFPSTLTQEDVLNGRSEIRNRVIARVFKELGYIEQWGSGINRIINSCKQYELKTPLIKENGDSVEVNIFRKANSAGKASETAGNRRKATGKMPETAGKPPEKDGVAANEKAILDFLARHEKITRKDVEELISVKDRRAREILSEMVKNGVLKKEGKSRNIYYTKK